MWEWGGRGDSWRKEEEEGGRDKRKKKKRLTPKSEFVPATIISGQTAKQSNPSEQKPC